MNIVSTAVHRRVPNLPVSPSRSPSSASLSVGAAHADCMLWDAEETTTTDLYDAYRDEAGSNLAAGLRGPKIGVHLMGPPRSTQQHWCRGRMRVVSNVCGVCGSTRSGQSVPAASCESACHLASEQHH